jgi:hypothetical protein
VNSPHPELEALAELADPAAVDTPPSQAHAELLAHVAECPVCTADLEALRAVRETLRALPPVPMPADLAERLEAALLAARTEDQREDQRTVVPMVASSTRRTGRGRWQTLPYGAAAAVLVVVGLATAAVIGISHSGDSKKSSATSVPEASGSAAAGALAPNTPLVTSGTSYTSGDLRSQITAVITASVPGAAQRYGALRNPDFGDVPNAAAASSAPAAATSAAPSALASTSASSAAAAPAPAASVINSAQAPPRTTPGGPLADPAALAKCVQTLAPGEIQAPVLVDYATFNGVPSTIIVLADPDVAGKLDVYVEADTANCANQEVTFVTFLDPAASSSP